MAYLINADRYGFVMPAQFIPGSLGDLSPVIREAGIQEHSAWATG
jgi:hypothetical protein